MKKAILLIVPILMLTGCIDEAIRRYDAVAHQVQLGESKEKVLSLLMPTQEPLARKHQKRPEQHIKDGAKVEIYYFRTGIHPDGLTTDDEFTPYVFQDGILTAIGWTTLGGPKTQGQTKYETHANVHEVVY